jgi:hypothetical protein
LQAGETGTSRIISNIVHKRKHVMLIRTLTLAAAASVHGSAAIASGVSTAVAVPIVIVGSALYVTGSALESVGDTVVGAGADLAQVGNAPLIVDTKTAPNRAPSLD